MIYNPDEHETLTLSEFWNPASNTILALAKKHSQNYFHKVDIHYNDFYSWYQCRNCMANYSIGTILWT